MASQPVNKSTAIIAAILTALAGAGGGAAAVTMQSGDTPTLTATIKGPTASPVGKLVTLTVDAPGATQVRWYPELEGVSHVCDGGRSISVTADAAGVRDLAVFASNAEASVVVTHRVSFGLTPTPKPDDCPPDVVPPKPKPEPEPQPDPVPSFGLAKSVPEWLAKVPEPARSQSTMIASVYRSVGQQAVDGKFANIAAIEAEVGQLIVLLVIERNLDSKAWKPFGESINAAFTGLRAVGRITSTKEYGQALLEVAGAM